MKTREYFRDIIYRIVYNSRGEFDQNLRTSSNTNAIVLNKYSLRDSCTATLIPAARSPMNLTPMLTLTRQFHLKSNQDFLLLTIGYQTLGVILEYY